MKMENRNSKSEIRSVTVGWAGFTEHRLKSVLLVC
jgi:hypothetical protein